MILIPAVISIKQFPVGCESDYHILKFKIYNTRLLILDVIMLQELFILFHKLIIFVFAVNRFFLAGSSLINQFIIGPGKFIGINSRKYTNPVKANIEREQQEEGKNDDRMVFKMNNRFKSRSTLLRQPKKLFLKTAAIIKPNNKTRAMIPVTSVIFGTKGTMASEKRKRMILKCNMSTSIASKLFLGCK